MRYLPIFRLLILFLNFYGFVSNKTTSPYLNSAANFLLLLPHYSPNTLQTSNRQTHATNATYIRNGYYSNSYNPSSAFTTNCYSRCKPVTKNQPQPHQWNNNYHVLPASRPVQSASVSPYPLVLPQFPNFRIIFHQFTSKPFKKPSIITASTIVTSESELPTPPPYVPQPQNVPPKHKARENPCKNGYPLVNSLNTPQTCNFLVKPNGGCPSGYWCHTGASYDTTVCCPQISNDHFCNLPLSTGDGYESIPRWYYDTTAQKCEEFLYKGLKGNANNFITSIQCIDLCEANQKSATTTRATTKTIVRTNPCLIKEPAKSLIGDIAYCGTNKTCPDGYYCHVGETDKNTVCCEHSTNSDHRCILAMKEGEGNSSLPRFYYNTIVRRCIGFIYKGTKGNENNFPSLSECNSECINPCPVTFGHKKPKFCSANGQECEKGEWCHIGSSKERTRCCPLAATDPCKLPLDIGKGDENLTRWFSDPSDDTCGRECRQFTYLGYKGNQNNFLTKAECEAACKPLECVNPCGNNEPLLDFSGRPKLCDSTNKCPSEFWCHMGASVHTTVCCSESEKRSCSLPKLEGTGNALLPRWYYDEKVGDCEKFIYKGIGGNQNNYVEYNDCVNACPIEKLANPCGSGKPLMINESPKICNPEHRCPFTHYCHIGADNNENSTNYCCPKNGDPCEQSVSAGVGSASVTRFYYDKEDKKCYEFRYKGNRGNANNFLSRDDCELVCHVVSKNPCQNGSPLMDDSNEPFVCGGETQCPDKYWCHVGSGPATTVCCHWPSNYTINQYTSSDICNQPVGYGIGGENLDRWYFDSTAQTCRKFFYGGYKGSPNNFLTRDSCREACQDTNPCLHGNLLTYDYGDKIHCSSDIHCPKDGYCHIGPTLATTGCCLRSGETRCELPLSKGTGMESQKRWHFNPTLMRCEPFEYAGIRGNENNFLSKRSCEETCSATKGINPSYCPHGEPLLDADSKLVTCGISETCPEGLICHMNSDIDKSICCENPQHFCLQKRETGKCSGNEIRYGYNPLIDSCVAYTYTGCGGTLNNFDSFEKCSAICCKQYTRYAYKDDAKNSSNFAILNITKH